MPVPNLAARRPPSLLLILLLALVALATGLGLRDPSPPDEPRFVLAARAMVDSGQWALPTRGSELYAHKPAVFMWLQAAAFLLVRDWQVAFLLPSLLAALGCLWLVHDLARRLWNRRVAALATCALLVTLQFGLQARRGQIDMLLVFWTTLALSALLQHLLLGRDRRLALLGGVAAGLGTVTKGVGFLPLLLWLPWRLLPAARRCSGGLQWRWILAGLLLGALVWLLPMLAAVLGSDDPALRDYARTILFRQTAERYATPWHHLQPAWYYLQTIATLWLPGVLLLPWLLPAWARRLRRGDPRQWLLLGWGLVVLLFFTVSPAKREVYIFPALPAFCLAAAPLLPGLLRRRGVRRLLLGYLLLLALACAALGVGGLLDVDGQASRLASERAIEHADLDALFGWLVVIGTAGLLLAGWGRQRRVGMALTVFTCVLWGGYGMGLAPALDASSSARALMQAVGTRIGPDAELGLVAWREQHLLQADRPAVDFGYSRPWHQQWEAAGRWLAADRDRRWLFVLDAALSPCVDPAATIAIGRSNRRGWLLLPGHAWPDGCETPAWPDAAYEGEPP